MQNQNGMQTWIRRGVLIALAAAAAFLWWTEGRYQPLEEPSAVATSIPAVPKDPRMKREEAYAGDVAALQALLESGAADAATQELAAQKLAQLIAEHQNEMGLEDALREAGYENAVVLVQNGAVTVLISEEKLTEENSAQILALCVTHAGVGAENVRVMGNR